MVLTRGRSDRRVAAPLWYILKGAIWRVLGRPFDRRRGVRTDGSIQPAELLTESENRCLAVEYAPTPARTFWLSVASLKIDAKSFVFVDLGSGKGKALLLASTLPFRRLEGVEFARDLHELACSNIRAATPESARDRFVLHHLDVAAYDFPDEPCVVYLFNPFEATLLAHVAKRLLNSFRLRPRDIFVVYVNPVHRDVLEALGFTPIKRPWWDSMLQRWIPSRYVIYKLEREGQSISIAAEQ